MSSTEGDFKSKETESFNFKRVNHNKNHKKPHISLALLISFAFIMNIGCIRPSDKNKGMHGQKNEAAAKQAVSDIEPFGNIVIVSDDFLKGMTFPKVEQKNNLNLSEDIDNEYNLLVVYLTGDTPIPTELQDQVVNDEYIPIYSSAPVLNENLASEKIDLVSNPVSKLISAISKKRASSKTKSVRGSLDSKTAVNTPQSKKVPPPLPPPRYREVANPQKATAPRYRDRPLPATPQRTVTNSVPQATAPAVRKPVPLPRRNAYNKDGTIRPELTDAISSSLNSVAAGNPTQRITMRNGRLTTGTSPVTPKFRESGFKGIVANSALPPVPAPRTNIRELLEKKGIAVAAYQRFDQYLRYYGFDFTPKQKIDFIDKGVSIDEITRIGFEAKRRGEKDINAIYEAILNSRP